ncbi:MAG: AbrB/MazE/SpoVT family DNA-binding domain-containing protein [Actinobacteria bacterium]|nr:AbrB/MazE/SpoVT family DNA-binding domain-containing protein [Actinomycetota bacterium]
MKISGIARKVDDLGRVVLPVELRRALGIGAGDEVDIAMLDGVITMRKVETHCTFCGGTDGLREFRGRQVCSSCSRELTDSA